MEKKLEGKKCPKFLGDCTGDKNLSNDDFIGKNIVIYFYPKDSTPGCTTEGQDFRDIKVSKNTIQKFLAFQGMALNLMKILNKSSPFLLTFYLILRKKCVKLSMLSN